jgi:hypothetical protein
MTVCNGLLFHPPTPSKTTTYTKINKLGTLFANLISGKPSPLSSNEEIKLNFSHSRLDESFSWTKITRLGDNLF